MTLMAATTMETSLAKRAKQSAKSFPPSVTGVFTSPNLLDSQANFAAGSWGGMPSLVHCLRGFEWDKGRASGSSK